MDDFPYTSNGKIDKRALRQMAFDKMARMQAEKEHALMATKPAFYSPSPYDGKLLAFLKERPASSGMNGPVDYPCAV